MGKWQPGDPRRSPGEGSFYEDAEGFHGTYVYYDQEGKRRRIHRRGTSKRQVMKAIAAAKERLAAGQPARDSSTKLADYLPRWLEDRAKAAVRPRTHDAYRWAVGKLCAYLPRETLGSLTPEKIDHAYARMVADGLAPSSVQVVHAALHQALDSARKWRYVAQNAATDARAPRVERSEKATLTRAELTTMLDYVAREEVELWVLWTVLGTAGLRLSEALGLRWRDVDLDRRRLQVTAQLSKRGGQFVEPKTAASRRGVHLAARAVAALRVHRAAQQQAARAAAVPWPASDLVFRTPRGEAWNADKARARWYRVLAAAGLPRITPHGLRHTVASLLLADGVPDIVVAELLGHASIRETVDTYGHVQPGSHEDAVARLDRLVAPEAPGDATGSAV